MSDKPTYEELAQRVRALEKEITQCKGVIEGFNQAGKEKEKLKSQLRNMIDSCPAWMACLDTEGNYLIANNYYTETFHIPLSQVEGHNFKEFFPPDLYERHKQLIAQSFAIGTSLKWEDQHMFEEDRITYLYGIYTPLYDETGSIWGVSAFVQDVTKLKQTEKDLKESEEKYRKIFNNEIDAISIFDIETRRFLDVNEAFLKLYGYTRDEVLQLTIDAVSGEPAKSKAAIAKSALEGDTLIPIRHHKKKDGTPIIVELSAGPFTWKGQRVMFAVVRDITEHINAKEALSRSEEKYRNLFHYSSDGIYVHDLKGNFIDANQKALEQSGLTRDEILSSRDRDLLPPGLHKKADKLLQEISQKGFICFEIVIKKKNGELLPLEISSSLLDVDGEKLIQSVARDISERKKLEEELLKVQKLESTGILAGGIAHDFNNLLMGILGNISLAKLYAQPDSHVLERLNDAEKASTRAQDLTQQLLTFSKGGEPIRKPTVIAGLLRDSISFSLSGSNVKSNISIPDKLWPVMIDEGQISQVIQNVIKNADQAMPDGGIVSICAENKAISKKDALPLYDGKYVKIIIADTGGGILKKNIAKVFDPYFSTKKEGSGLGLASAYSIIKNHDGFITVDSQQEKGTTFQIYLPISEEALPLSKRSEEKPLSGVGKILIMDDEKTIVQVAVEMLNFMGYNVEAAKDGSEAITLYKKARRRENKPFDVVMLDLTIPGGMGGKETIKKLLEIDPSIKAIVSSGYANDPIMANFLNFGFSGVVAKPYTIQKLSEALLKVLGVCRTQR